MILKVPMKSVRSLTQWFAFFCYQGQADPLNSAFHLTYNMVLNLLRVEEVNPEIMLEKSFHQFQNYASVPGMIDSKYCFCVISFEWCFTRVSTTNWKVRTTRHTAVHRYYHMKVQLCSFHLMAMNTKGACYMYLSISFYLLSYLNYKESAPSSPLCYICHVNHNA